MKIFLTHTKQNYEIVALINNDPRHCIAIFKRNFMIGNSPKIDFGWANYYDINSGTWAHGHYDYADFEHALDDVYQELRY